MCIVLNLSLLELPDLVGLPQMKNGRTSYATPAHCVSVAMAKAALEVSRRSVSTLGARPHVQRTCFGFTPTQIASSLVHAHGTHSRAVSVRRVLPFLVAISNDLSSSCVEYILDLPLYQNQKRRAWCVSTKIRAK